jgi:tetratricopeptide (TPR) repeat protein
MQTLSADYPDDENAAAFYALALLGSSGPDRDFAIYMQSAAVSEGIIARNPLHPGAVHYLIHAYDDPIHAPLGLRPALTYAEIAPAATHALHMPSHIFFPLGMWDAATRTNVKSFEAGQAWGLQNNMPVNSGGAHALSWLVYSLLQEGKYKSARDYLQQFQDIVAEDAARGGQFVETWAAYLVDTEYADADFVDLEFDADKMSARRSSMYYYVKAAAAIKAGEFDNAKVYQQRLAGLEMKLNDLNWSEKAKDVMLLELQALLLGAQGDTDQAVRLLQQAAEIEYAMPRRFGPPWPPKPSHELLGEVLAEQGEYDAARQQFKIALSLAKARSASLLGLARASAALDQDDEARRIYAALATNWTAADTKFPAMTEARNLTGSTQ